MVASVLASDRRKRNGRLAFLAFLAARHYKARYIPLALATCLPSIQQVARYKIKHAWSAAHKCAWHHDIDVHDADIENTKS
jgi:hypothetical protein